jgi:hypothetical protein
MHILVGEPPGPDQKLDPPLTPVFRMRFSSAQKVALGENSYKPSFVIHNGQTANSVVEHAPHSLLHEVVLTNDNHLSRHHVYCFHDCLLNEIAALFAAK